MRTDYEKVAQRYDRNAIRVNLPADPWIAALPAGARVLDLACGTGGYLAAQAAHHAGRDVRWYGVDASAAMLAVAAAKGFSAELTRGEAEALPYADATFDYAVCRFAVHHFADKAAAVREMARVVKRGGRLRIENFAPELSRGWWLYRYFPEAVAVDEQRFWSLERLSEALRGAGFAVAVKATPMPRSPLKMFYDEAMNRETSELVLIDDAAYARGAKRIADDYARDPDAMIDPGFMLVDITADR